MKKSRLLNACSFFIFFLILPKIILGAETAVHPGSQDFDQALSAVHEGSLDEAEDHFKKALVLEPNNPEYHFEFANLYALQHDDSEKVGDRLGADRKMQQAANELEQAVMAKPDFLPAHFNLGVVYKKLGKYEAARKEFKEVLTLDPSQVSARMQIGATYETQGFYDEAEGIYKDIHEQYPQNSDVNDALEGLSERREKSIQQEQQSRSMRMNSLSSMLPGLSQNGRILNPQMYGNDPSQQQSAGIAQALPFLGQWALQQFMKRKDPSQ